MTNQCHQFDVFTKIINNSSYYLYVLEIAFEMVSSPGLISRC